MPNLLHEAISGRYHEAVKAGDIHAEVRRRDGKIVPEVEYRIPKSDLYIRTLPQRMSWNMQVGDNQGHNVRLPIGELMSFSAEPMKFVVDKRANYIALRDRISRLGDPAVSYLVKLFGSAESVHAGRQTPLEGMNAAVLAASDPETGARTTVAEVAGGLMALSIGLHQQFPQRGYVRFDNETPFGQPDQAGYWAKSQAVNGGLDCRVELQTAIDQTTMAVKDREAMCSLTFPVIEAWETHDGMIAASELDLLLEDSEAMVLNVGAEAGFSHLTADSLARVTEILRNSRPYAE